MANRTAAELGEEQWQLSRDEYASLPAFKKTTEGEEAANRYKGSGLIQAIGMTLKMYR
mgnify:CR=1 FL=1